MNSFQIIFNNCIFNRTVWSPIPDLPNSGCPRSTIFFYKNNFSFPRYYDFVRGGVRGGKGRKRLRSYQWSTWTETDSADYRVVEPPAYIPLRTGQRSDQCGAGNDLTHRRWLAALSRLGFIVMMICTHPSNNESLKGTVLGTLLSKLLTLNLQQNRQCPVNDPCVRPQIPMIITEGLQTCALTAQWGPVTGILLLSESSLDRKTGVSWWLPPRMDDW